MALILDGTTGIGIDSGTQPLDPASLNAVIQALIPTGTKMLFQQTAAPTGWTKDTSHDNKALRVVSGTASTGGSVAFTTAFASGLSAGNTTLTTAQMPSHSHIQRLYPSGNNVDVLFPGAAGSAGGSSVQDTSVATAATGSSNSHNHTIPSFDVSYVDLIIATKD